jgi:hypothetical protein
MARIIHRRFAGHKEMEQSLAQFRNPLAPVHR